MEESIKAKNMYLDHLFRSLIDYKKNKGVQYRDDVPAITKRLLGDIKAIYEEVTDAVTEEPSNTIGEREMNECFTLYFNSRAIKLEHQSNWKLIRQLDHLTFLREKIIEECKDELPPGFLPDKKESIVCSVTNSFGSRRSNVTSFGGFNEEEKLEES